MYGNVLTGQDISKIINVNNFERIVLRDTYGNAEKYKQVVLTNYQGKCMCILRKKDDFTFGAVYEVVNLDGQFALLKEVDIKVVRDIEDIYFAHYRGQ